MILKRSPSSSWSDTRTPIADDPVHRSPSVGDRNSGFIGDVRKSNEKILEAIQMAWHEEYKDVHG